jgi:hypothetical protein
MVGCSLRVLRWVSRGVSRRDLENLEMRMRNKKEEREQRAGGEGDIYGQSRVQRHDLTIP